MHKAITNVTRFLNLYQKTNTKHKNAAAPNRLSGFARGVADGGVKWYYSRMPIRDKTDADPPPKAPRRTAGGVIAVRGARQNNLKNIDIDFPLGELMVVTGVSGSGKSSLAFDTVYAEGQRRYIETFSAYARQFFERMDPPDVDAVEGIPPAVAIRQVNPVRTSRSTVGTMTELNDHLKLLFARRARPFCPGCQAPITVDTPDSVFDTLMAAGWAEARLLIVFYLPRPDSISEADLLALLERQGYRHVTGADDGRVRIVQDRVVLAASRRARIVEALEAAFEKGRGELAVVRLDAERRESDVRTFSNRLSCPDCRVDLAPPTPNLFSFNSPIGACETCRGFGRTISFSEALVIPDATKSIADGCVKPFQTASFLDCQRELMQYARKRKFPVKTPWMALSEADRRWVLDGDGGWDEGVWWGVKRFFDWLESRAYKMHVRVMLSRYREYTCCPACQGSRLKPAALNWRLVHNGQACSIHDIMLMPVSRVHDFFDTLRQTMTTRDALTLFDEIMPRLRYLIEVGLGYLTLDRQSRTLSGGEVQRINLTQALGSSLVNTLFVLDEPSIGLHPRDVGRLVAVLKRLRDAGNTVLVVEHDPDVIRAADRVVEMGPGPGDRGGRVIFNGRVGALATCPESATRPYLFETTRTVHRSPAGVARPSSGFLRVRGAREHNLRNITVDFPLNRLVVVTGVSGSGKSTLVNDVLHTHVQRRLGRPVETCGVCDGIDGVEKVSDCVLVDQSPIGKTTRSTPASYVGAFDLIRKQFARLPAAVERGYGYGDFSFNAGVGRCPVCEGSGYELVEMQFLSDVYLKCEECGGRRYRRELCDVLMPWPSRSRMVSIADVLEMTVDEALDAFAGDRKILAALQPLVDVGLGYLRIGQPVPTLSGGEAQRLKLAGHLAAQAGKAAARRGRTLFLLDEPTTGLHFSDIETLNAVLRRLVEGGDSVVVIEHNLMVILAADHVIDLGPEGGSAGGDVVATGTPEAVAAVAASHTGQALHAVLVAAESVTPMWAADPPGAYAPVSPPTQVSVRRAHAHNLRNIDVDLPLNAFSVITGVSGSGKSTLAFDILFASGQRRYLECLNAYARQFVQPQAKPDVLSLTALPPTVAIEQRLSQGGWTSTVATVTEIYNDLRLLFLTVGRQHCPSCGKTIAPQTPEQILARLLHRHKGSDVQLLARLVSGRKGIYKELAAWAAKQGFKSLRVDGQWRDTQPWTTPDRYKAHDIDLPVARVSVREANAKALLAGIRQTVEHGSGMLRVAPTGSRPSFEEYVVSTARACGTCGISFETPDPRLFSFNSHRGRCPACNGYGVVAGQSRTSQGKAATRRGRTLGFADVVDDAIEGHGSDVCAACGGSRLNATARAFRFHGFGIADLTAQTVSEALKTFSRMKFSPREQAVAGGLVADMVSRLAFLEKVGLGYLPLDRAVPTLSGGEGQRIRLAAQLGSNLCGVCYILDEPTIGLHPRDTGMLLETLSGLRDKGNTVLVVEHDEQTMRRADHIVDMGPGAGVEGGRIVAQGSLAAILRSRTSQTARCLREPMVHPQRGGWRPCQAVPKLTIRGAALHNVRNVDVAVPLGRFTVVSGVSGSGKSTLVRDVLYASLHPINAPRGTVVPSGCRAIEGAEAIQRVLEVDQTPIGRTPRSCPATYVGFWTEIRALFAATPEARIRGYDASRFSFNIVGGRCSTCDGQGLVRMEMAFLPDVSATCETCGGARFNAETLNVTYNGKNIAEVLAMSVSEALPFFSAHPAIRHSLQVLLDVGLGYLSLGQQSSTLSGGEAQRIKLVTELARCTPRPGVREQATLYVLDEPTVGLHMADVDNLLRVVHKLVDGGHTVVMIEHNTDVIAEADWVIDLGPEGGDGGGRIVAQGSPRQLARRASVRSHTARFLREMLSR